MNNVKFDGSKTQQSLVNSCACKCQTGVKYKFFADIARKEGYEKIARIFEQTSEHEFMHAKLFFNHLENTPQGNVNCTYSYKIGTTEENLQYALSEEKYGCQEVYAKAEETALNEGFDSIASTFRHVKNAQSHHAARFQKLYEKVKNKTMFDETTPQKWFCLRCGYVSEGNSAPDFCPCCYALKSNFEMIEDVK